MLFEDFVPVGPNRALITAGPSLVSLDVIQYVDYSVEEDRIQLGGNRQIVARGEYLRLGGNFGGENQLVFSDVGGIRGTLSGVGDYGPTAHQPFLYEGCMYYTDGPLETVNIYKDGQLYQGPFGEYTQLGNPCWGGGSMYFEARKDPDPRRPDLWELWRRRPDGELELVRRHGANPAYWNGYLFWGEWNGRSFNYHRTAAD